MNHYSNEFTHDRPWLGELHLVAIFNRALTAQEVVQNTIVGPVITQAGPALLLQKEPTAQTVVSGGTAMFTLTVRNAGDVELFNLNLTDPDCGSMTLVQNGNGDSILNVGEIWVYTCSIANVVSDVTNTATVSAEDSLGTSVSASASGQVTVVSNERVTAGQVAGAVSV